MTDYISFFVTAITLILSGPYGPDELRRRGPDGAESRVRQRVRGWHVRRRQRLRGRPSGNAKGSCRIPVRRRRLRLRAIGGAQGLGQTVGLTIEFDGLGIAFEGQTIDAARNLQLAAAVDGLSQSETTIEGADLSGADDADIDLSFGEIGNDVQARASANDSRVDGQALSRVAEGSDARELMREFGDGARAFQKIETCVGGDAFHSKKVVADAFARGFAGARGSGRGLEDQDGVGFSRELLGDGSRLWLPVLRRD